MTLYLTAASVELSHTQHIIGDNLLTGGKHPKLNVIITKNKAEAWTTMQGNHYQSTLQKSIIWQDKQQRYMHETAAFTLGSLSNRQMDED